MIAYPTDAAILAPFVLLAYTTETLTGFGAALVAITLGAHFIPIETLIPVLVPLNIMVTGTVFVRHRNEADYNLLLKRIVPFMGAGLAAGLLMNELARGLASKGLLGFIVVFFATRQLWMHFRKGGKLRDISVVQAGVFQIMAGIVQALYTMGGPFLIYSVSRLYLPKSVFRATLCAVWAASNGIITIAFFINGRINAETLKVTVFLIPILPLGILLGEMLHNRINEEAFRLFTYILLFLTGLPLILR